MEPFKLTLQQVTFEQDQLDSAQQLDSFDTVVNYDSSFSVQSPPPTAGVTTYTTNSTTSSIPARISRAQGFGYLSHSPQPAQYQIDPVWSEGSGSPPHQRYLINPDDDYIKLTESYNGQVVPSTAAYDIALLSQVTANTAAANKHITKKRRRFVGKTTVISSTSTAVTTMPSETTTQPPLDKTPSQETEDNTPFETVAEALRLQWSVIGNKDITPVSPDVVAQVVAEAEKKLKASDGTGNTAETPPSKTASQLSGETTPSVHSSRGPTPIPLEETSAVIPNTDQKVHAAGDASFSSASSQDGSSRSEYRDAGPKTPDSVEARELIRIPAKSLTLTTTKEKSHWFGGKDTKATKPSSKPAKEKSDLPRKASASSIQDVSLNGSVSEDTRSLSSVSSELEMEKYSHTETDAFLKTLPPVKSVDMTQFVVEKPPSVSEISFKPVNTVVTPAAGMLSSDSGLDMDETSAVVQPLTSTPNAIKPEKQLPFLPQIGPLFPKSEPVHFGRSYPTVVPKTNNASPAVRKQLEEVLREKAKLEGQLEVLTSESQTTLQERAELQAQLASLRLKLLSQKGGEGDPEKQSLKKEVEFLKRSRESVEQSMRETQKLLEEKIEEARASHDDLQITQDAHDKLQLRMKDLRDDIMSKEVAIQALKNKVAELYVEVQNGLQAKIEHENETRSAKSDLISLLKTKEWYQQQLQLAHDVRSQLQKELTILQAQSVSQGTIVERLKTDNARLRLQLNEAQQRALKQKEMLAKHLETIETDMMEREAAFQEIQRERAVIEDTFNSQINSAENERSRLTLLMQLNNDLEARLDKAQEDLKKKHNQIFSMENEQMDIMKRLTLTQETLLEKEKELEDVNQKLIEVEAQLKAFQAEITGRDKEILKLREEKASAEIMYQSVKEEKMIVDRALDKLQQDMYKVEKSFKAMKSELATKQNELDKETSDRTKIEKEMNTIKKDLNIKNRSFDSMHKDYDGKSTKVQQLLIEKTALENEVSAYKEQLGSLQSSQNIRVEEWQTLTSELSEVKQRLAETEHQLREKVEEASVQQSSAAVVPDEKYEEIVHETHSLKEQLSESTQRHAEDVQQYNIQNQQLNGDLSVLKEELTNRQKAFEENVSTLTAKLHDVIGEKQKVETELEMSQRKFELSSIEQQGQMTTELQRLASELESARLAQQELQSQLIALHHAKETEAAALRQELSVLEQALQQANTDLEEKEKAEDLNQQLSLELEKERGRLAGLVQNNSSLKQHVSQLEEALARRESSLVEVHGQLTESMSAQEHLEQDYLKRIQGLEDVLQKEKEGQRDLRKQIGTKITENKRLKKQADGAKQDSEQLKQDLQTRDATLNQLQADLDSSRQNALSQQTQLASLTSSNRNLGQELERVKRDLSDNMTRHPLLMEQIQSLTWQLQQKTMEVEQVQEQLKLAEQRQQTEIDSMKRTIQEKQDEIDALKGELSSSRKEKLSQKTRVSELRSALKSSVQHHKLAKKIMTKKKELLEAGDGVVISSGEDKATQVNLDIPVAIPAPSYDIDAVEKLLQDTAVKALDSKPLDNLQNCLSSLRSEISGLQRQMDVHTTTVHTSNQSWRSLESEVNELREVVKTVANTTQSATAITANATDTVAVQSDVVDI